MSIHGYVRLNTFDSNHAFQRGRSNFIFYCWYLLKCILFLSCFPWPSSIKVLLLRYFGASIGDGVVIKPRVNIHFPWRISIGDNVWIGECVEIINFESVVIGSDVCLSQQVFVCTGDHDFRDTSFSYRNQPITIEDGVWLQSRVFVCPGSFIGSQSVITACSVVKGKLPENQVCSGSPCIPIYSRWR